jgi:AraC family transcriptional regulator, transcriptional activator of pobA
MDTNVVIMKPHLFDSISALLRTLDLPKPLHPLVTLGDRVHIAAAKENLPDPAGKINYGQHYYVFEEGTMVFMAPGQVTAVEEELHHAGYSLRVHPDLFRNYPLGKKIKRLGFFSYSVNEALHLAEREQSIIINIFQNLEAELKTKIADFADDIIVSQIERLRNYHNRCYKNFNKFFKNASGFVQQLEQLVH